MKKEVAPSLLERNFFLHLGKPAKVYPRSCALASFWEVKILAKTKNRDFCLRQTQNELARTKFGDFGPGYSTEMPGRGRA